MSKEDMEAIQEKIEKGLEKERKEKMKKLKKKSKEERKKFGSEFKKFITRGNVVDLAVAVVIGSAFNAITNGLVKFIINPVISLLTNGISLSGLKTILQPEELDPLTGEVINAEVAILWGEWIQTIIQFFIIALTVFIMVKVIKNMTDKLNKKEIEAKKAADEKKKAEDKAAADAAAKLAAEKEAQLQEFYANIKRQTELLEKLTKDNN